MKPTLGRIAPFALLALLSLQPAAASPPLVDAAAVALHAGNASNAVALATQALADPSLTPRDRARVLVERGLAHEMLGEHDTALLDLTEAINAHALTGADLSRAFYNRGVALDALGQTDDAIGDYAAAVRIEPHHSAALNNRGNAYRRLGRLAEAGADYKASLAAGNPHPEYPNYGLGQIAEAQGDPALARTYYQAALNANPQFSLAAERITALNTAPVSPPPVNATPPQAPSRHPFVAMPPASAGDTAPVVLRPPGTAPAPSTSAATVTPLQPYVPPGNPAATNDGPIVLHPPRGAAALPSPPAGDDSVVHLHPPAEPVHLHPPRTAPPPRPIRTATAAPPAAAPPPQLKPALGDTGKSEMIQLGAWRNEADAVGAWNDIQGASGTLLSGLSPQVVPVDLPGQGRYYRLRAGPVTDGAAKLCAALNARKLGCMVAPK